MRYLISMAGDGTRWSNYRGVRKHFAPINNEPNIHRTIRLLRQFDKEADIYIGYHPDYFPDMLEGMGLKFYNGRKYFVGTESDRYYSSMEYWSETGPTVLIWGDVFFTEEALRKVTTPFHSWVRTGRTGTGIYKAYGEEFSIGFTPSYRNQMIDAMNRVESITKERGVQLFGAVYLAMFGLSDDEIIAHSDSGRKPNLGNMIEINDLTDDFDTPEDYNRFLMHYDKREGNRIVIGVPTAEFARQAKFYDYLFALDKPDRTTVSLAHGQSPAHNRNAIIDSALEVNATHVFFVDDDLLIPQDTLTRLLAHDKDIVSGLYLTRNFPHAPIAMDIALTDGSCRFKFLKSGETGLVEAVNFGLGCCLIKTDVFRKMEKPWIRLGQLNPQEWNDDIEFFNRARHSGYQLWLDLDVRCGHMATVAIWPQYNEAEKQWLTLYDSQGRGHAAFFAATPDQVYGQEEYDKVLESVRHMIEKEV